MGRKYRPDIPTLAQDIKGTTLVQIFSRYFPDPSVQAEITRGLDEWERNMSYDFIPGALGFLRDIRRHGVRCAVVTSSNRQKMRAVAEKMPEFHTLFDRILTSEDFAASKPAPDCYIKGAEALGCRRDNCVVFEDAFTGLQAGMSAGIFTIGLATYNPREAIQQRCDYVTDDFTQLSYNMVETMLLDNPHKCGL